jgi:hypothetical protein
VFSRRSFGFRGGRENPSDACKSSPPPITNPDAHAQPDPNPHPNSDPDATKRSPNADPDTFSVSNRIGRAVHE